MLKEQNMEVDEEKFNQIKGKARNSYDAKSKIFCPYFGFDITLNSDGFHHLQFSARRERSKKEQLLKFRLLPLVFKVIKNSGTVQEMRSDLRPFGKRGRDGFIPMKTISYFAFIAIIGEEKKVKIKTILRRVGGGNVMFWSVMPCSRLKNGQKLYSGDIEDE